MLLYDMYIFLVLCVYAKMKHRIGECMDFIIQIVSSLNNALFISLHFLLFSYLCNMYTA